MGIVKHFFTVLLVLVVANCFAQPDPIIPDPPPPPGPVIEEPSIFPEIMPAYPGGEKQLMKDIFDNLVFPQVCVENDFGGKVFVRFVVEKNGKISNVTVLKQPQGDLGKVLAKEAIRVVRNLKDFTPGTINGEPKRVYYTLPINFHLQ